MTRMGTLHPLIGPVGAGKTTYGQRPATRVVYLVDAPRDVRRERVLQRNKTPGPFTQIVPLEFFERASDLWQPPSDSEHAARGIIDV